MELKKGHGLTMTPPLLNDSVLPNLTPAMFHEWLRWRFESSSLILETFEAIVCARARLDNSSYEAGEYYQSIIEKAGGHQR